MNLVMQRLLLDLRQNPGQPTMEAAPCTARKLICTGHAKRHAPVAVVIIVNRQRDLLQMVLALHSPRRLASGLNRR